MKHIEEGAPRRFICNSKEEKGSGKSRRLAWAVGPEDGTSAIGLPSVPRNLDWVRLAQRFPCESSAES